MQDEGSTPVSTKNFQFSIANDASLSAVEKLLKQLSRNNSLNPQPDGATFSTTIFEDPPQNEEFKVSFNQSENDTKNASIITKEQLAAIIGKVREWLRENTTYLEIAQSTALELNEKSFNGGAFLYNGVSGVLETSRDYESKEQGLKDSLNLLLQLVTVLNSGETPDKDTDENFIAAQIPEELQRYIASFNLKDWETHVFPIIQQLHKKVETYKTVKQSNTTLAHTLPDYRKFINAWLKKAFETTDPKLKVYFDVIKESIRKELQFADSNLLAEPLQKSAEDERALELLYEKFNKVILAIYKEKPVEEALKDLVPKEDLQGGSGGESDADEDQTPDDEEIEEPEESETITINEAESLVKDALYELLLKQLEIEEQISANDFLSSLPTTAEQTVFREQLKTEIYIQIIDTVNIRPRLNDPAAEFFDEKRNTINRAPFLEQLEALSQAALFSLNDTLTTPAKGFDILTVAFQFARMSSNDYVKEDLTAQPISTDSQQSILAGLPAAFIAENNIESFQDLENLPQALLLQEIREVNQQSYLQEKRRLENVFLSYLQNNGANISQLSELDYGLQLAINNELDAYFSTLSSEELARLFIGHDSTFRLTTASRLNRELLLGRFNTAQFYAKLHQFTQNNLIQQQESVENNINQVLQNNNQQQIDLTQNSPEEIDRMSIEEFKKAFPAFSIPDDVTPEVFARFKQQAIEAWSPASAQQGIIQRLMVAYGSDTAFIYTLNSVDKINFIFGLNLPESLTDQDLSLIQQSLATYWQLQIEKVANERNYYLNTAYADQQNLDDQNSNSQNVRAYTERLTSRTFSPAFSQITRDQALLAEQGELLEQAREVENYHFRLYLTEQELLAQEENVWNQRALIARQLLMEQTIAGEMDRQASLSSLLEAQITTGYQQQAQQGRMGQFARRLGIGKSGKDKAAASMAKAKREAVQNALSIANPALGTLNKLGDTIEDITGLSKDKQAAAAIGGLVGLAGAALRALYTSLSGIIGGVSGAIGGAILGSALIPIPIVGTLIGGTLGYIGGNVAGNFIGSAIGNSAAPTLGTTTGASSASAAGVLPKINPLTTTAGFTIGTFTLVTATTALITQATINSALLLPTIGEDNQISKFVVIEKLAVEGTSFDNGAFPNPITYQVTIRANDTSNEININTIAINSMTDTLTVNSRDETADDQERIKTKTDFGYTEDEVITLGPGESVNLEYTQNFIGQVVDASINNRFEIGFTVTYSSGNGPVQTETTTAFTAETICVGDCPSSEGCWPVSGIVTQLPFNKFDQFGKRASHAESDSFDIAAAMGTDVYAPFDGVVTVYSESSTGYGNSVQLVSTDDHKFIFAHLVEFDSILKNGSSNVSANVTQGQRIGAVGSTGNSTGPHLHYEVAIGGRFAKASGASIEDSLLATLAPDGLNTKLGTPVRSCGE